MSKTIILFLSLLSLLFLFYFIYEINVPFLSSNNQILLIPNKSILGIFIASQLTFAIPLLIWKYIDTKNKLLFIVLSVCSFLGFLLLVYYKGRASWLGLFISIFYIFFQNSTCKKYIYKYKAILFFIIISLVFFLIKFKTDSSNGRLLIYKISSKIFTDNPLFGVGFGNFKANYNNYQATYFASHSIDSKEALLADNAFYAFNDYYQFIIENGIVGLAILIAIGLLFYKKIWNTNFSQKQMPVATAAKASIICILVASLFSYPLQILPIICQFVFCVSMLTFFAINNNTELTKNLKLFYKLITAFLVILFILFAALQINYKMKSAEAFELTRAGFKLKAIEKYKHLSESYFNDGNDMFLYAKELYNTKQITKAKAILDIAKNKISFNEVYKLSAEIEIEEKEFAKAEKDLKTVVYMIPNKMQPRLNLMEFYLSQNDTTKAVFWANSITNMPVKIPSETTKAILLKVKRNLK